MLSIFKLIELFLHCGDEDVFVSRFGVLDWIFRHIQNQTVDILQDRYLLLFKVQSIIMKNESSSDGGIKAFESDEQEMGALQSFKQQMLKAWLPIPTLTKTYVLFFIMSAIFISIGVPMLVLSNNIIQYSVRYDNQCTINTVCTVSLTISNNIPAPVFVYYELHNYYQNHRLYTNSISYKQLQGQSLSVSQLSQCSPYITNANLPVSVSLDGTLLVSTEPANPCGIVAYTYFTDMFSLFYQNGTNTTFTTDGIAWPSDVQRFTHLDQSKMWRNITDPRFMNWIRISALPNFRKLWAKINSDLPAGTYSLQIDNIYDVSSFNAEKYFVIGTTNFFGGRNQFLSIIYIIMGVLCFIVGIFFCVRRINKNKNQ